MAKKELSMRGLNGILPLKPFDREGVTSAGGPSAKESLPSPAPEAPAAGAAPGRRAGRPVKDGPQRRLVSAKMLDEHYRKVGIIAYREHLTRQDLMDLAFSRLVESYEKAFGALDPAEFDSLGKGSIGF